MSPQARASSALSASPSSAKPLARAVPTEHRARQLSASELEAWDLVIGMDAQNVRDLNALSGGGADDVRIRLLRSFDAEAVLAGHLDVPDPYYGDEDDFSAMFDLIEPACRGLLAHVRADRVDELRAPVSEQSEPR